MQWKLLQDGPQKTYAIVFQTGDEAASGLLAFAREHGIKGAEFTAVGAFSGATLGYFDWQHKDYVTIPVSEQVEVLSMTGNVALYQGKPKVHAHVVAGKRDGSTVGGHLMEAHIRPTLEVILTESPAHLVRHIDDESGLALITPQRETAGAR